MSTRRGRFGLLGGAVLAIAAVWAVSPAGVPLFDGVGFPDEPYRYVDPPEGGKATKPPGDAIDAAKVSDGTTSTLIFAFSEEQAAQITVSAPSRAFEAPDATKVTVKAVPEAPESSPDGTEADGNVYAVSFTADRGSVTTTSRLGQGYLLMRSTTGKQPGPTMYYRAAPSDEWKPLNTVRVGNDIYQSPLPGAGQYSLAFDSADSGSGAGVIIAVLVILVAIVIALLLIIRLRRGRTA